eukprot:TRINITY_DN186_c0_g5_i1.p1 TRINITY_DN186_c0_g5~~TRINITY_DN186_c0_g5_i1.p1  ORF type:complete len:1237 (-),score=248.19 TRINITY_DN186_c0_g5_i1:596-4306(-)
MSGRRKVSSRAAIPLRDFHGGQIPSEVSLPSAPGASSVTSSDLRSPSPYGLVSGHDYRSPLATNGGRGNLEPAGVRVPPPTFVNPGSLGRNYEEDERGRPTSRSLERPRTADGPTRPLVLGNNRPLSADAARSSEGLRPGLSTRSLEEGRSRLGVRGLVDDTHAENRSYGEKAGFETSRGGYASAAASGRGRGYSSAVTGQTIGGTPVGRGFVVSSIPSANPQRPQAPASSVGWGARQGSQEVRAEANQQEQESKVWRRPPEPEREPVKVTSREQSQPESKSWQRSTEADREPYRALATNGGQREGSTEWHGPGRTEPVPSAGDGRGTVSYQFRSNLMSNPLLPGSLPGRGIYSALLVSPPVEKSTSPPTHSGPLSEQVQATNWREGSGGTAQGGASSMQTSPGVGPEEKERYEADFDSEHRGGPVQQGPRAEGGQDSRFAASTPVNIPDRGGGRFQREQEQPRVQSALYINRNTNTTNNNSNGSNNNNDKYSSSKQSWTAGPADVGGRIGGGSPYETRHHERSYPEKPHHGQPQYNENKYALQKTQSAGTVNGGDIHSSSQEGSWKESKATSLLARFGSPSSLDSQKSATQTLGRSKSDVPTMPKSALWSEPPSALFVGFSGPVSGPAAGRGPFSPGPTNQQGSPRHESGAVAPSASPRSPGRGAFSSHARESPRQATRSPQQHQLVASPQGATEAASSQAEGEARGSRFEAQEKNWRPSESHAQAEGIHQQGAPLSKFGDAAGGPDAREVPAAAPAVPTSPAAVAPAAAARLLQPSPGLAVEGAPLVAAVPRPTERPKLKLVPRTAPLDNPSAAEAERSRTSVFGGARPREEILKERGVDEAVIKGVPLPAVAAGALASAGPSALASSRGAGGPPPPEGSSPPASASIVTEVSRVESTPATEPTPVEQQAKVEAPQSGLITDHHHHHHHHYYHHHHDEQVPLSQQMQQVQWQQEQFVQQQHQPLAPQRAGSHEGGDVWQSPHQEEPPSDITAPPATSAAGLSSLLTAPPSLSAGTSSATQAPADPSASKYYYRPPPSALELAQAFSRPSTAHVNSSLLTSTPSKQPQQPSAEPPRRLQQQQQQQQQQQRHQRPTEPLQQRQQYHQQMHQGRSQNSGPSREFLQRPYGPGSGQGPAGRGNGGRGGEGRGAPGGWRGGDAGNPVGPPNARPGSLPGGPPAGWVPPAEGPSAGSYHYHHHHQAPANGYGKFSRPMGGGGGGPPQAGGRSGGQRDPSY